MESGNYLRQIIVSSKGKKFNTYSELAQLANVNQGNLSSFMKPEGDPKRRENITFDSAWKILKVLGVNLPSLPKTSLATIKRPAPYAPTEIVIGENLPSIPVMGATGAGNAVELFNAQPERWLPVLPQYLFPDLIGLVVEGDSMEPTIHKGAIVGVVPYDGSISEGAIYLVHRPPFGRTIKRIKMGHDDEIVLHSDNPAYTPTPVHYDGYDNFILGRVVWIWQTC